MEATAAAANHPATGWLTRLDTARPIMAAGKITRPRPHIGLVGEPDVGDDVVEPGGPVPDVVAAEAEQDGEEDEADD
jgi:hypothetical protein